MVGWNGYIVWQGLSWGGQVACVALWCAWGHLAGGRGLSHGTWHMAHGMCRCVWLMKREVLWHIHECQAWCSGLQRSGSSPCMHNCSRSVQCSILQACLVQGYAISELDYGKQSSGGVWPPAAGAWHCTVDDALQGDDMWQQQQQLGWLMSGWRLGPGRVVWGCVCAAVSWHHAPRSRAAYAMILQRASAVSVSWGGLSNGVSVPK